MGSARPSQIRSDLVATVGLRRRARARRGVRSTDASDFPAREVLDAVGEGILIHDLDGVIVFSNVAADRILGLPAGGAVGIGSGSARWLAIHEDGSPLAHEESLR